MTPRRDDVALATWAVIGRVGLARTSMREIAREAGCSTGVLTHHFRNKEELLDYAFSLAEERIWKRSAAPTLLETLLGGIVHDDDTRTEMALYLSMNVRARSDPARAERLSAVIAKWEGMFADLLRGEGLTRADALAAAQIVLAVVDGVATRAFADPSMTPERQEAVLRETVRRVTSSAS